MDGYNFFLDQKGHLRSGWRLGIFTVAFFICVQIGQLGVLFLLTAITRRPLADLAGSNWGFLISHGPILVFALLLGWACGALLEELPFSALGASFQKGWLRDLAVGSLWGLATLLLAGLLTFITSGIRFDLDRVSASSIGRTLFLSALIFVFAAAAEELLFRGYPLQTLTRANLAWLGVLLTSVPFAMVHLFNPNVVPVFTFLNTAIAGVWLSAAYLKTRRLWFPLGVHWSWNWAQASLLGIPVSGINRIAPAPLLHAIKTGPDWLTGGAYGIEGGAACTVALILSTLLIWRMKLLRRRDETIQGRS